MAVGGLRASDDHCAAFERVTTRHSADLPVLADPCYAHDPHMFYKDHLLSATEMYLNLLTHLWYINPHLARPRGGRSGSLHDYTCVLRGTCYPVPHTIRIYNRVNHDQSRWGCQEHIAYRTIHIGAESGNGAFRERATVEDKTNARYPARSSKVPP